jgi:4'-phosphopantetheinyl transferase
MTTASRPPGTYPAVWKPVTCGGLSSRELLSNPHRISVWCVDLDHHARTMPLEPAELDAEERERARRFATAELRRRFVAAHLVQRRLLGLALGIPASAVRFARGRNGKPLLATAPGEGASIAFNLSHSEELALLALARLPLLGVDIERRRALSDRDAVARRVFTFGERARIDAGDEAARERAFFAAWARKEAVIKATGEGLSAPLREIEVQPESSSGAWSVRRTPGTPAAEVELTVLDLDPQDDFAAAIALPRGSHVVECFHLVPDP